MIQTNYHHLYYFYVIANSGTMSRAAEKLLLNQSTLSVQLRQFERSLGRALFERRKQRLHLTPDGRRVLEYARRIFEAGKEMEAALKDGGAVGRRTLTVGVLGGTPRAFGHALLRGLRLFDPEALIVLREGPLDDLLAELREFKLDAMMTDASLRGRDREDLENHLLAKIPVVLAAAPRLARRFKRLPADFEDAPFVIPSAPSQVYNQILDLISEWKVRPRVVAEIQDVEIARRMALSGDGVVPLNAYTVSMSLPKGGLSVVGGRRDWGLREAVHLITRRAGATAALVSRLRGEFESHQGAVAAR